LSKQRTTKKLFEIFWNIYASQFPPGSDTIAWSSDHVTAALPDLKKKATTPS